ncbi:MAG: L-2-hydroxyglutarate oxidase [Candidatus Omnitrophica bacterium]|nr:L-2-hydroxyglutarate oxidase [Candidatus Omnitrophota bacterium]
MNSQKKSFLIIGGGIVGLATAREILLRNPEAKVTVLEKESQIALHQSGHNSGVIHSGIYYKPGTEKAKTCREGIRLLHEFCEEKGIVRRRVGKLIIAISEEERQRLGPLKEQGLANGIKDIKQVRQDEIKGYEPSVSGIEGIYLPEVALVDFKEVSEALKADIEAHGGEVVVHRKVTKIVRLRDRTPLPLSSPPLRGGGQGEGEIIVLADNCEYKASFLINCAGLYSDKIARLSGLYPRVRIVPFRGEYFWLNPEKAKLIRGLVYGVPDPRLPFLGMHLTPTLEGRVKVGPNAVLALAREGYFSNQINAQETFELVASPVFWRMALRYWKTGISEVIHSRMMNFYLATLRKFLPTAEISDLTPGPTGVRAQAVDEKGQLVSDFYFMEESDACHVLNAPSPAATAALAIAKRVVDQIKMQDF